jgi:hypothetical protein
MNSTNENIEKYKARVAQISELYRKHLLREPDEAGLVNYANSSLALRDIEAAIMGSYEYAELSRKDKFVHSMDALGTNNHMVMGSTPRSEENVKTLVDMGVQAVLDLNDHVDYDSSVFPYFLNVPVDINKELTTEQVDRCVHFMYENVVICSRKTFIHSDNGLERAPLVMCLFLMAARGFNFGQAIRIIIGRQRLSNPPRHMITSKIVERVMDISKKLKDEVEYVRFSEAIKNSLNKEKEETKPDGGAFVLPEIFRVSDKMYVGGTLSDAVVKKLCDSGVKIIFDMNSKDEEYSPEAQKLRQVRLPVSEKDAKTLIPAVIRSTRKYMKQAPIYVYSKDMGTIVFFIENYISNMETNDIVGDIKPEEVRARMLQGIA